MSNPSEDPSTPAQKAIVCGTAFSTSCACFFLGALVVLPLFAKFLSLLHAPDLLIQLGVVSILFALPVAGAIVGLRIGLLATGLLPQPAVTRVAR